MRTMYDAVTASGIPVSAQMVAGYVDGRYQWSTADWDRFPNAVKIRIAVFATTDDGHVLDVEPGNDMTPSHWISWVQMRRAAGVDPTIYVGENNWGLVRGAFQSAGVAEPHYWVARYDGVQQIPAGSIAKQYADDTMLGHPYDLSVVADYWPGIDQGADMPLTQSDVQMIFDYVLPRGGANVQGSTSLGGMVAWNDSHVQTVYDTLAALQAEVKALSTPVPDTGALAAQLSTDTVFLQALAHAIAVELHNITPAS